MMSLNIDESPSHQISVFYVSYKMIGTNWKHILTQIGTNFEIYLFTKYNFFGHLYNVN